MEVGLILERSVMMHVGHHHPGSPRISEYLRTIRGMRHHDFSVHWLHAPWVRWFPISSLRIRNVGGRSRCLQNLSILQQHRELLVSCWLWKQRQHTPLQLRKYPLAGWPIVLLQTVAMTEMHLESIHRACFRR